MNSEQKRLSVAICGSLRHDSMVGSASSLINEQTPTRFKRIEMTEYLRGLFACKLDGKYCIDFFFYKWKVLRRCHENRASRLKLIKINGFTVLFLCQCSTVAQLRA